MPHEMSFLKGVAQEIGFILAAYDYMNTKALNARGRGDLLETVKQLRELAEWHANQAARALELGHQYELSVQLLNSRQEIKQFENQIHSILGQVQRAVAYQTIIVDPKQAKDEAMSRQRQGSMGRRTGTLYMNVPPLSPTELKLHSLRASASPEFLQTPPLPFRPIELFEAPLFDLRQVIEDTTAPTTRRSKARRNKTRRSK